jgi:uncharacterized membrane protein YkoI
MALALSAAWALCPARSQSPAPLPGRIILADAALSMEQAVKMAEQRFNARVVRAQSESEGGRTVYVLRLLNDSGRVWTVKIDAATGSVT